MNNKIAILAQTNGLETVLDKTYEELAEFCKAVNDWKNICDGKDHKTEQVVTVAGNLLEEIADVQIMFEQLAYVLNSEKVVEIIKKGKTERQLERFGLTGKEDDKL